MAPLNFIKVKQENIPIHTCTILHKTYRFRIISFKINYINVYAKATEYTPAASSTSEEKRFFLGGGGY